MAPRNVKDVIENLLETQESVASREVARAAGVSRQTAHAHLRELVEAGRLVVEGRGRSTRYRRAGASRILRRPREGLEEERVWRRLHEEETVSSLPGNVEAILHYAVTEMVNNAIEHSGSGWVEIRLDPGERSVRVVVVDDGVGIFDHVAGHFGLDGRLHALQEISKGKVTTDPEAHTGEGIFFTSKAVDRFEVESGGLRWIVDNRRDDVAVGSAPEEAGTRVEVEIDRESPGRLEDVFAEYTGDFAFTRTRTVVKLFELGTRFISRSEAKRLLRGLERFREAVLDFEGVETVGQGFVDEVFRVWARAHPETRLTPVRMAPPVAFMVRRGLPSADGPEPGGATPAGDRSDEG